MKMMIIAIAAIMLGLMSAKPTFAQIPQGVTPLITNLEPVVTVTTDPLTGLTQSQTTREVVVDIAQNNFLFTSPCTFESITINGKLNVHFKTVMSSSGRLNEESHSNQNGSGVGSLSGVKYVYSETNDTTDSYDATPALHELTMSFNQHLIRQGETIIPDDFYFKILIHFTIVHGVPVVTNVSFGPPVCQ